MRNSPQSCFKGQKRPFRDRNAYCHRQHLHLCADLCRKTHLPMVVHLSKVRTALAYSTGGLDMMSRMSCCQSMHISLTKQRAALPSLLIVPPTFAMQLLRLVHHVHGPHRHDDVRRVQHHLASQLARWRDPRLGSWYLHVHLVLLTGCIWCKPSAHVPHRERRTVRYSHYLQYGACLHNLECNACPTHLFSALSSHLSLPVSFPRWFLHHLVCFSLLHVRCSALLPWLPTPSRPLWC